MVNTNVSPKLTQAEEACLRYAHQGLTYKETAQALSCLPATVDTHLKHVRQKMGVSSTRAAARLYFAVAAPVGRRSPPSARPADEAQAQQPRGGAIGAPSVTDKPNASLEIEHAAGTAIPTSTTDFNRAAIPRISGAEAFGSDEGDRKPAEIMGEPAQPAFVSPAPIGKDEDDPAFAPEEHDDLSAWEKTKRIAFIAVGAALAAGATLPGTLLLLHALQTLHGSR